MGLFSGFNLGALAGAAPSLLTPGGTITPDSAMGFIQAMGANGTPPQAPVPTPLTAAQPSGKPASAGIVGWIKSHVALSAGIGAGVLLAVFLLLRRRKA